jgi:hypothetical protein
LRGEGGTAEAHINNNKSARFQKKQLHVHLTKTFVSGVGGMHLSQAQGDLKKHAPSMEKHLIRWKVAQQVAR